MKPVPFQYCAAVSIERAIAALAAANGEARVLAGGQTLGPMLNLRLATPAIVVDIGRIGSLKRIERKEGRLVIGSCATHAMIEDYDDPSPTARFLSYVASTIAHRAIRNRGTIGGSLAHADPASDWVTTMTLLDARVTIASAHGVRLVMMRDFVKGVFSTAVGPNEIIEAVDLTPISTGARWGYYKICRKVGAFPDAIGAVLFDPQNRISRVLTGALDGPPMVLTGLGDRLLHDGPSVATPEAVGEAVKEAVPHIDPVDLCIHAAAVRRAIHQALPS